MGDCCSFPWSGWTSCCLSDDTNERLRLKWKGYNQNNSPSCQGSKEFQEIVENCGAYQIEIPDSQLPKCSALRGSYGYGSLTKHYITDTTITEVTTENYRIIPDGTYSTTNGFKYEIINGQWFRLTAFGGRQAVNVQQSYSQGAYIYKLGGLWYRFNNNRLYQTSNVQSITSLDYDQINVYDFGYVNSGVYTIGLNQYEIYMNNGQPIWSRFNGDGTSTAIEIEDKSWMNVWYYKFEGTWYTFDLGTKMFTPVTVLPWERVTPSEITEVKVIQTYNPIITETYTSDSTASSISRSGPWTGNYYRQWN